MNSVFHRLLYEFYSDDFLHPWGCSDTNGTSPTAHIKKSVSRFSLFLSFLSVCGNEVPQCAIKNLSSSLVHLEKGIWRNAELETQNLQTTIRKKNVK